MPLAKSRGLRKLWTLFSRTNCVPDFLRWSFGKKQFASPVSAKSMEFKLWFSPTTGVKPLPFREEVLNACRTLDQRRRGRPIALCFSGGINSELIAIALSNLNIPFEMYFLDIWGLNRPAFDLHAPLIERRLGKTIQVVELNRAFFYEEHSPQLFREFGVEYPTYLALTHLFDRIPRNQFIVVGDGGMSRSGNLFAQLGKNFPLPPDASGIHLPFSTASVFYYLWAQSRARRGEFYFFSSTPGLISATINNPLFRTSYPISDAREVIYRAFPEIERRDRTTNWDGSAYRENSWIRNWLQRQPIPNFDFWHPGAGTVAQVDVF